jgi:hypothetical protein
MDKCASVLLSFPPAGDEAAISSNEQYDRAVKAHLTRLNKFFKHQAGLLTAHASALLQVRFRSCRDLLQKPSVQRKELQC